MRRFAMLSALLALAACGGDEEEPKLFGGFAPTGGGALLVPSGSCDLTIPGYGVVTVRLSAVAVGLTDYADACGVAAATEAYFCGDKASSTIVFGIGIRMNAYDLEIADAGVGTWPVTSNPQPDVSGTAEFATAAANQSDASCFSRPGSPLDAYKGRLTVATVDERVTGDVDLTFEGGSRFGASFDVPVCPVSIDFADFCAALNGTLVCESPVCVP
jgi:hypothetical protein